MRGAMRMPGANARNQLRGAKAQQAGEGWEAWLARQHQVARQRGIARIRKVSPWVKILKKLGMGRFMVAFTGDNGCDYLGPLRGGRTLVAEAKASDDPRLGRSAFDQHQLDDLDAAAALGALALALVQLRVDGRLRRFAAPWPLNWRERGNGAGVGLEELGPWEIREGELYLERWAA